MILSDTSVSRAADTATSTETNVPEIQHRDNGRKTTIEHKRNVS